MRGEREIKIKIPAAGIVVIINYYSGSRNSSDIENKFSAFDFELCLF